MNKKSTAINLTDYAQEIKNRLSAMYSLKSVVSAGLALLDALEPIDREQLIFIVAEGSDAEIRAFVTELCARYTSKGHKRNQGQRPSRAG